MKNKVQKLIDKLESIWEDSNIEDKHYGYYSAIEKATCFTDYQRGWLDGANNLGDYLSSNEREYLEELVELIESASNIQR